MVTKITNLDYILFLKFILYKDCKTVPKLKPFSSLDVVSNSKFVFIYDIAGSEHCSASPSSAQSISEFIPFEQLYVENLIDLTAAKNVLPVEKSPFKGK